MNKTIYKAGFWSGLAAFRSTVVFCIVQALQMGGVTSYPPDEILIYGTTLCIVIPFVIKLPSLHYATPGDNKFLSHAALILTAICAVFVTANCVVELTTGISMSLKGVPDNILILKQTPHLLFWGFATPGYIFMGLATVALVPVFEKKGFQNSVRLSLPANRLVTPSIATAYFYPRFLKNHFLPGYPGKLQPSYQCHYPQCLLEKA